MLWTKYGLYAEDSAIVIVNGFGMITSLGAVYVYLAKYKGEEDVERGEVRFLLTLLGLLLFFAGIQLGWLPAGWIALTACASSILMYASPLVSLKRIVSSQDASVLSVPVILITLAVCFVWLLYGLQLADRYVIVPNVIGTGIGLVQLGLYLVYGPRKGRLIVVAGEKAIPMSKSKSYEMVTELSAV